MDVQLLLPLTEPGLSPVDRLKLKLSFLRLARKLGLTGLDMDNVIAVGPPPRVVRQGSEGRNLKHPPPASDEAWAA